ncbi:MAG: hypothetical protein AAFP19_07490 [Bacteroidota bacterium]
MTNLVGTWRIFQQWEGQPGYSFNANFLNDGTITVNGNMFFGTYKQLGNSNQVALAICDFRGQSVTAYVGNIAGNAMGGEARGARNGGQGITAVWSAQKVAVANAETKEHFVPNFVEAPN